MAPQPILLSPNVVAKYGIHIRAHESAFRENSATIVMPSKEAAFLNPVQEFNRDLSTLAIITWSQIFDCEKRQRYEARQRAREMRARDTSEPDTKRIKTGTSPRRLAGGRLDAQYPSPPNVGSMITCTDTNPLPSRYQGCEAHVSIIQIQSTRGTQCYRAPQHSICKGNPPPRVSCGQRLVG